MTKRSTSSRGASASTASRQWWRARATVHVEALDHRGEPVTIDASGWYARILQHEIDHLKGTLYIDRMRSRTLSTNRNMALHWAGVPIEEVLELLTAPPDR